MSNYYPGVAQQGTTAANVVAQTSGATTTQTATVAGSAGSRIVLRKIIIYGNAAATATLQVKSGATLILDLGTLTLAIAATVIDLNPFTLADGATLNVVVGAASAGATVISLVADKV